ncbi:MAG TPA: protein-tyrosine-phosphatase [Alphaproteobacteria bacterium]|nr:protein-tyrosine-phosphatase [Alphaproteobacteria bacterium]
MYKVLFVCTGNICRSPTAEGVFRQMVENAGLQRAVTVDSAGISSWHAGQSPDSRAVETALKNGVDISSLRARKVVRDDFQNFDLIIALDASHLQVLEKLRRESAQSKAELKLLMKDYAPETGFTDVPDPYYGGYDGFQSVFDLIRAACTNVLASVREKV